MERLAPDEVIESVTLSPTAKYLLVGLAGAVCGLVIGLGVSAILTDVRSDAPHLPTRARVEDDVPEMPHIRIEKPEEIIYDQVNTPPTAEELAKDLGIDLNKDS